MFLEITLLIIFYLLGVASFSFILFMSIQKGQWLDLLFNWQDKLRKWDVSGTKKGLFLSKIFGFCELCFSHLVSFVAFWFLLVGVSMQYDLHFPIFIYVIWYFIQVPLQTVFNLFFITKLFKK
ncbi:hypothetical protein [Empedobacter sp.]|uniref:hypothetical protein n=1 Tax=Empedobacter sp. TaxID=1927715 RepID=UPI00289FC7C5|nr:hypothetical protein [Empedobacter sp.]